MRMSGLASKKNGCEHLFTLNAVAGVAGVYFVCGIILGSCLPRLLCRNRKIAANQYNETASRLHDILSQSTAPFSFELPWADDKLQRNMTFSNQRYLRGGAGGATQRVFNLSDQLDLGINSHHEFNSFGITIPHIPIIDQELHLPFAQSERTIYEVENAQQDSKAHANEDSKAHASENKAHWASKNKKIPQKGSNMTIGSKMHVRRKKKSTTEGSIKIVIDEVAELVH